MSSTLEEIGLHVKKLALDFGEREAARLWSCIIISFFIYSLATAESHALKNVTRVGFKFPFYSTHSLFSLSLSCSFSFIFIFSHKWLFFPSQGCILIGRMDGRLAIQTEKYHNIVRNFKSSSHRKGVRIFLATWPDFSHIDPRRSWHLKEVQCAEHHVAAVWL